MKKQGLKLGTAIRITNLRIDRFVFFLDYDDRCLPLPYLIVISALRTKDSKTCGKGAKVQPSFRRFSSAAINSSSRLTRPAVDEFSWARRIKYGSVSATGP